MHIGHKASRAGSIPPSNRLTDIQSHFAFLVATVNEVVMAEKQAEVRDKKDRKDSREEKQSKKKELDDENKAKKRGKDKDGRLGRTDTPERSPRP